MQIYAVNFVSPSNYSDRNIWVLYILKHDEFSDKLLSKSEEEITRIMKVCITDTLERETK